MAIDANELWKAYQKGLTRRHRWDATWEEIARYEFPRRLFNLQVSSEGDQQTQDLFDSTATFSSEILAASLQSGLTNQAIRWFTLRLADEALMANDDVKSWLEDSTTRMLAAFAASNMSTESSEMYLDIGVFGIGAMFVGEHDTQSPIIAGNSFRGLRFETIPLGSYVIEEDSFGRANGIYYRIPFSADTIASRWGIEPLSEPLANAAKENPTEEFTLIHVVLPTSRVKSSPSKMAYSSVWMEEKSKHVIAVSGFMEFPFVVPRWAKAAGEAYGRGPGYVALPDVKTLNKTIELNLKAMAIATQPPILARHNSVIGAIDLSPGGLTVVRNMEDIKEMVTRANFAATDLKIQDLRQSVRRVYYVDQLLQLLSRETPMMTATEVAAKMQLLREILGPAFARLESEFLNPLVDRTFNIMLRAGAIDEPPDELSGQRIEVDYESPIGLAKRGQELTAMDRVTLRTQELVGMGFTEAGDNIDPDEIIRRTAEVAGSPRGILRKADVRDEIRANRKEAEATQRLLETMLQGSEVAKNVAPLAKVSQGATPVGG